MLGVMQVPSGAVRRKPFFTMQLNAYILAADPTWLERSVQAYYPFVQRIVVSFDNQGRGWTGLPIPVEECLQRLRRIDAEAKMVFCGGCFSGSVSDPMQNDTAQRNAALELASAGADWILQVDTDEWLPHPEALLRVLKRADALGLRGVEWPMRVLYRKLPHDKVLEVCAADGGDHFEYIAPIAVRSGTRLQHSRRTGEAFLRPVVNGDRRSMQLLRSPALGEIREELISSEEAIVHNSWARSPWEVARKLMTWSHSGWKVWVHYAVRWLPAAFLWPSQRNVHPLFGPVWPALRVCSQPIVQTMPEPVPGT